LLHKQRLPSYLVLKLFQDLTALTRLTGTRGILCLQGIFLTVRQYNRSTPNSKKTVWNEHAALVPKVPILGYIFSRHHQYVKIPVRLQEKWDEFRTLAEQNIQVLLRPNNRGRVNDAIFMEINQATQHDKEQKTSPQPRTSLLQNTKKCIRVQDEPGVVPLPVQWRLNRQNNPCQKDYRKQCLTAF
jgi:hypothetical protein